MAHKGCLTTMDNLNESDIELMPLQVAERLEGSAGCAQFPRAFRDLHSQVQVKIASNPSWGVYKYALTRL